MISNQTNRAEDYLSDAELVNIRAFKPRTISQVVDVNMPGGKEDTNRALILAALSNGLVELQNVSLADDSLELMEALATLGVSLRLKGRQCRVTGTAGRFAPNTSKVYAGISGTSSRFVAGLCMLVPGQFVLDCGSRMRERPMRDLLMAMRTLGVDVRSVSVTDHLPIEYNNPLEQVARGGQLEMSGETSSQFFTSLLLVAGRLSGGLEIKVLGNQVSQSYIDMTQYALAKFGVPMQNDGYRRYIVPETRNIGVERYVVESDATAATYFLALAAITAKTVRVHGLLVDSPQGDARFYQILESMGCSVNFSSVEQWIEVTGPSQLQSCTVDMLSTPDSAQTLAVVAVFAQGRTRITGLGTLRLKETDRLAALERELTRMGIEVITGKDWIEIVGGQPHGAIIKTYEDHRMAMSFSIAGAVVDGLMIAGADTVSKSFPEFWETLEMAGVESQLAI